MKIPSIKPQSSSLITTKINSKIPLYIFLFDKLTADVAIESAFSFVLFNDIILNVKTKIAMHKKEYIIFLNNIYPPLFYLYVKKYP